MKKIFATVLAMLMLFTCAAFGAGAEEAPEPEAEQTWAVINEDGTLTVTLKGNATTGYMWSCAIADETVATLLSGEYVPDEENAGQAMVGAGGLYTAQIVGANPGETTVTFNYARSWEEAPIETHVLKVIVGEDNAVAAIEDITEA